MLSSLDTNSSMCLNEQIQLGSHERMINYCALYSHVSFLAMSELATDAPDVKSKKEAQDKEDKGPPFHACIIVNEKNLHASLVELVSICHQNEEENRIYSLSKAIFIF